MSTKKHLTTLLSALLAGGVSQAANVPVTGIRQINPTTVEVQYGNGQMLMLDFYGKNIFRMFHDPNGGIIRDPRAIRKPRSWSRHHGTKLGSWK